MLLRSCARILILGDTCMNKIMQLCRYKPKFKLYGYLRGEPEYLLAVSSEPLSPTSFVVLTPPVLLLHAPTNILGRKPLAVNDQMPTIYKPNINIPIQAPQQRYTPKKLLPDLLRAPFVELGICSPVNTDNRDVLQQNQVKRQLDGG